jgi:hypothetical protein
MSSRRSPVSPGRALVLGLAVSAELMANQQVPPTQQRPAERGAELLRISFAAVDAAGIAVPDLRREEVLVRIDGRERTVRSLQLVVAAAGDAAPLLPPPFGSNNTSTAGRTVALILDDESFPPGGEQAMRRAIERLVAGLSPSDRMAIATIPHGGVRVAATTDHGKIRSAIGSLVGRGAATQSGSDLACRSRDTLQGLTAYLRGFATQDAPTIVAFMTAGLAAPRRDAAITSAPGMCELLLDTFREVGAAAGRARAQFYVIPPVEIMKVGTLERENIAGAGAQGSDNPLEGIEQLIGVTGARRLNLGGGEETAFDRILTETAAYYVAAIEPQRSDRGRSHALEVDVSRRDVDVRSSRAITFPEVESRGARSTTPSLRDMLSTTEVFRDLPLRAAAYSSFEEPGGAIRILALAEPVEPGVKLASLMAALFDRDGKGIASWVAQPSDLERSPVMGAIAAPAGGYRLRVAAIDTTGRTGTADYEMDVDLARSGTLRISSILLGLSRGGAFVPRLQFIAEPVAIGYVEMSGAAPGAKVTATLELADTANAPARMSVPLSIESGAAGRYVGKAALPIGALPPGDYVVRAMVGLDDHPMTRVIRTLRKAVPAER